MILETYTKQPSEVQDYDIDFGEYLQGMGNDTIQSFAVAVKPTGLTAVESLVIGSVVKVFLGGGESGKSYVVEARVTTAGGRVREGEIQIKVKEY